MHGARSYVTAKFVADFTNTNWIVYLYICSNYFLTKFEWAKKQNSEVSFQCPQFFITFKIVRNFHRLRSIQHKDRHIHIAQITQRRLALLTLYLINRINMQIRKWQKVTTHTHTQSYLAMAKFFPLVRCICSLWPNALPVVVLQNKVNFTTIATTTSERKSRTPSPTSNTSILYTKCKPLIELQFYNVARERSGHSMGEIMYSAFTYMSLEGQFTWSPTVPHMQFKCRRYTCKHKGDRRSVHRRQLYQYKCSQ